MYETIAVTVDGPVLTLTLNRPAQLNAATSQMHTEIVAALDVADADDAIRAVVVTGAGRAFCAGTDLSEGFGPPEGDPATGEGVVRDVGGRVTLRLFSLRKPVIGAINGAAVGFGATFLLPMDFRLAVEGARFGYVFSRRGIVTESCSSWFLPRIVGMTRALDWALSGRLIPATEALAAGLLTEVLPADELLPRAHALARDLAENTSPASVALIRQLLWRMEGESHPMAAHRLESRCLSALVRLPDVPEGVAAFREKRAPRFSTRPSTDLEFADKWWSDPSYSD
ncbi:enoyl-CoA hydratase-related protein [Xanthobacter wiegelii]|uniref:enoyl-CoA hydratase-related protein n=1 Tax=Xanthobacter wiegelii TaxID=3119913 RepID=UPI003726A2AA